MNHILRIRSIVYLLCFTTLFTVFSCTDELQKEVDELKQKNSELQNQLDLKNASIEDLEDQKDLLENQKIALQSDTSELNAMIGQLEMLITNRYVERFMKMIFGSENLSSYTWQHLYDESFRLHTSFRNMVSIYNMDQNDILAGNISYEYRREFEHHYDGDKLTSSTDGKEQLDWIYDGRYIVEVKYTSDIDSESYTVYKIDPETGFIKTGEYYKTNELSGKSSYEFANEGLISKSVKFQIDGEIHTELFGYDINNNLTSFYHLIGEDTTQTRKWEFDNDGKLTFFNGDDGYYIDTVKVEYPEDGFIKVTSKRERFQAPGYSPYINIQIRGYNSDRQITYHYSKYNNSIPSEYAYEYENGYRVKEIFYNYTTDPYTYENFVGSIRTKILSRTVDGIITDEEEQIVYYDKAENVTGGNILTKNDITWDSSGYDLLSYTENVYDLDTVLISKMKREGIETEGYQYDKKVEYYQVANGIANYVYQSIEYTDFFKDSPFAPKRKVESIYNEDGLLNSSSYLNNNNSPTSIYWILE